MNDRVRLVLVFDSCRMKKIPVHDRCSYRQETIDNRCLSTNNSMSSREENSADHTDHRHCCRRRRRRRLARRSSTLVEEVNRRRPTCDGRRRRRCFSTTDLTRARQVDSLDENRVHHVRQVRRHCIDCRMLNTASISRLKYSCIMSEGKHVFDSTDRRRHAVLRTSVNMSRERT
jgi:hypothetical protein